MSFFDKLAKRLELDDFDKRDKTAFIVLSCVAVIVLVLWFFQLKYNIVSPLYGGLNPKDLQQTNNQTTTTAEADLKSKDTDQDGLSDWDEMNLYKTSPYLADSDSDGTNDYEEIKKGTDPNCPTGQDCSSATSQGTSNGLENQSLLDALNPATNLSSTTVTPQVAPTTGTNNSDTALTTEEKDALKKVLGSTSDPAVLRSFLLANGADAASVNALSDADLQKVINEILK